MGSQSSTFSLSWVPYLSQAWRVGAAVGGEMRGLYRVFPALDWPSCPLTFPAPAQGHLLCVNAQWRGKDCSAQSDENDHSPPYHLALWLLFPVPSVYRLIDINKPRVSSRRNWYQRQVSTRPRRPGRHWKWGEYWDSTCKMRTHLAESCPKGFSWDALQRLKFLILWCPVGSRIKTGLVSAGGIKER